MNSVQWETIDYCPVGCDQFFRHVKFSSEFLVGTLERQRCEPGSKACRLDLRVHGVRAGAVSVLAHQHLGDQSWASPLSLTCNHKYWTDSLRPLQPKDDKSVTHAHACAEMFIHVCVRMHTHTRAHAHALTHTVGFSELSESKLQISWPFYPIYFSLCFLRIMTSSYITTVQLLTTVKLTWAQYFYLIKHLYSSLVN